MSKEYTEAYKRYTAEAAKAKAGDANAAGTKAKIMGEIREMERESARRGVVLNPLRSAKGEITVQTTETSSRRSLQEEYVRKFNDKEVVQIPARDGSTFKGTLREFHTQRLLRRA